VWLPDGVAFQANPAPSDALAAADEYMPTLDMLGDEFPGAKPCVATFDFDEDAGPVLFDPETLQRLDAAGSAAWLRSRAGTMPLVIARPDAHDLVPASLVPWGRALADAQGEPANPPLSILSAEDEPVAVLPSLLVGDEVYGPRGGAHLADDGMTVM